jgi:hypothetical protein
MENYEYFWIPEANLRAARECRKKKNHKLNIEVPTRRDVARMEPAQIRVAMLAWMCNSVTEIIPSRAQISEARLILLARDDVASLMDLIEMCDNYIRGE